MTYSAAEARGELLSGIGEAADELALAIACLGEAYEQLDEYSAEKLEQQLFAPVQLAYGRAKRTHTEFAQRYDLPTREFEQRSPGMQSLGAKELIEKAVQAAGKSQHVIAELQDSMAPVEVGDAELRAGLSEVRELISGLPASARELVRTVGR